MTTTKKRLSLKIQGAVQGVGFRPFIYRLATELELTGWVNNSASGVFIEVEGDKQTLQTFLERVETEKPPRSLIQTFETKWLDITGYNSFEIRHSIIGEKTAVVLPDLSTCSDCLQEIFDPHNRRYHYPFTNCTNCGPRYSIIEALPYDRVNTTMKGFKMCPECQKEYDNPLDRRFHAQPNACPKCGPHLELWNKQGQILATHHQALLETAAAIRQGKIITIKGLGGFHLVVDANNTTAVRELRKRKRRNDKPFAVMYPSLKLVKKHCQVTPLEQELLLSPETPIVLLKFNPSYPLLLGGLEGTLLRGLEELEGEISISCAVAPGNPYIGVMLPYTPLHHLLMTELGFPVIATSGNLSDEPICIDEKEALDRLNHIADLFLVHNRPIIRPVDDSVVRIMGGKQMILRRARGYAPLPMLLKTSPSSPSPSILAVGGHLKNTVAIARYPQIFLSQHIGDLETTAAFKHFQEVMASLGGLYDFEPEIIACDAHPDYISTKYAQEQGLPVVKVQHHYAHVLACMAEHGLEAPVLGVAWDGTGYGEDNTIWGGEFLYITPEHYHRLAHFRPWKLAGGDKAAKEPRRVALGLLEALNLLEKKLPLFSYFSTQELTLLKTMFSKNINTPLTSSVGRLFDGVASLLGMRQQISFEGQAAMDLEFIIGEIATDEYYYFSLTPSTPIIIDWSSIINGIIDDISRNVSKGEIAAKFHNTLVEIIVMIAKRVGKPKIVLTGGCFQNRYLLELAIKRLQQEKFCPYWPQIIPPNDGGIALGQAIAALRSAICSNF